MSFYPNPETFYACTRAMLTRIQEQNPEATQAMVASRLIITLRFEQPEALITVNGRWNPARATFGSNNIRPDLELRMTGDVFHQILLGEESIKKAASMGLIQVRGPVWKLGALAPIITAGKQHYPAILREMGKT